PPAVLTDAYALRIESVGTIGRGARRAYPFAAALMPLLLLFEALLQRLHQFLPPAHGLDFSLLLVAEIAHRQLLQPVGRQLPLQHREQILDPLEVGGESAVVAIVEALVLHQTGSREVVEALGAQVAQARLQRFQQREQLGDRYRHAVLAQQKEEFSEHCADSRTRVAR